ncbi:MAG: peptidylprolyl isomerase [Candidatus Kapaibacterium sp.]|jgi:peptidyl-prolyl cis-trans isomerase B (cyclophilin B)
MKHLFLLLLVAIVPHISAYAQWTQEEKHPQYAIDVTVAGEKIGTIDIELDAVLAPRHVRNFDSLVAAKFYDGSLFHRIIPGFVIQGGDPNTKTKPREKWGQGDSTQTTVPAEFSMAKHLRGTISAARKGNDVNSATSQFFICVADAPNLDTKYSVYGSVIRGMEVADKIVELSRDEKDRPIERVEMVVRRTK